MILDLVSSLCGAPAGRARLWWVLARGEQTAWCGKRSNPGSSGQEEDLGAERDRRKKDTMPCGPGGFPGRSDF